MDAQVLIQIYRTGFFICAAITVLGLMLSILLFFRFRIREIWEARTGRAEKKAIFSMQEASRNDGRMRRDEKQHGKVSEESPPEPTEDLNIEKNTEPLASECETELLDNEQIFGCEETIILAETEELLQTEVLENQVEGLVITQQVVLIHTEERIP